MLDDGRRQLVERSMICWSLARRPGRRPRSLVGERARCSVLARAAADQLRGVELRRRLVCRAVVGVVVASSSASSGRRPASASRRVVPASEVLDAPSFDASSSEHGASSPYVTRDEPERGNAPAPCALHVDRPHVDDRVADRDQLHVCPWMTLEPRWSSSENSRLMSGSASIERRLHRAGDGATDVVGISYDTSFP